MFVVVPEDRLASLGGKRSTADSAWVGAAVSLLQSAAQDGVIALNSAIEAHAAS